MKIRIYEQSANEKFFLTEVTPGYNLHLLPRHVRKHVINFFPVIGSSLYFGRYYYFRTE